MKSIFFSEGSEEKGVTDNIEIESAIRKMYDGRRCQNQMSDANDTINIGEYIIVKILVI